MLAKIITASQGPSDVEMNHFQNEHSNPFEHQFSAQELLQLDDSWLQWDEDNVYPPPELFARPPYSFQPLPGLNNPPWTVFDPLPVSHYPPLYVDPSLLAWDAQNQQQLLPSVMPTHTWGYAPVPPLTQYPSVPFSNNTLASFGNLLQEPSDFIGFPAQVVLGAPVEEQPQTDSELPPAGKARRKPQRKKPLPEIPGLDKPLSEIAKCPDAPRIVDSGAYAHRSTQIRCDEIVGTSKRPGKVKRPMNRFMLYRRAYLPVAAWLLHLQGVENPEIPSLVRILAKSWSMETEEIRNLYDQWGAVELAGHMKAFPNYKFAPQKRS